MYKYKIKLYPEAVKKREGIDLSDTKDDIINIVKLFNEASSKVNNKKVIEEETLDVKGDTIYLTLLSNSWLEFPTRALRFLITRVAKLEQYVPLITENGRLFKGESEFVEESIDESNMEKIHLTDEEVMIELVKIFNRKTSENRKIIDSIRKIIEGR